ncbi:NTP transferase domain-containing protein, partial [Patescibacteria group bacterium]|nr:NTP transferase domain-containing protein [Patescibacteria group bacterium]MBU4367349.1 NTP transferase domain-containing protein [Patescibacteria group bacterium]MBU4461969.1 NTP transferase domain-containing protein [Patescibacteria group bacterium]MCG2699649.1 NTP transferase domain-containing protein [Candidatus Parcubacteria bacterium]
MSDEIKKAIIPVAGLGTRFLPLSKALPKEFFPLADKPVIQYIVEEAKNSGISEIIFVVNPNQKIILNYFKKDPVLERILIKRKKENLLKELKDFEKILDDISFSVVVQKKPLGDGHAILQAAKAVGQEPVAVLFADDVVVDGDGPALSQLMAIYKTCNCPVLALKKMPQEKLSAYGVPAVERIASRLYKIKKLIEKPEISEAPSDLVVVGKYILTPEVFDYLKKASPSKRGEVILAEVFDKMLLDGKIIYGYDLKGEWLECGDKEKWMKSFLRLCLKDHRFGPEL